MLKLCNTCTLEIIIGPWTNLYVLEVDFINRKYQISTGKYSENTLRMIYMYVWYMIVLCILRKNAGWSICTKCVLDPCRFNLQFNKLCIIDSGLLKSSTVQQNQMIMFSDVRINWPLIRKFPDNCTSVKEEF